MVKSKQGIRNNQVSEESAVVAEMSAKYSAVIRKDGKWWIGWIQEIPGVNSQGVSRAALIKNLKSALTEALELNRAEARKAAGKSFEVASISI